MEEVTRSRKRRGRWCCYTLLILAALVQGLPARAEEGQVIIRSSLMIKLPAGFEGLVTSSETGGARVSGGEDRLTVVHEVTLPATSTPTPTSRGQQQQGHHHHHHHNDAASWALCYAIFAEVQEVDEGQVLVNKVCSVIPPRGEALSSPIAHLYVTMALPPEHPGTSATYDLRGFIVSTDEMAASLMVPVHVDHQGSRSFLIPWHAEDAQLDLKAMATEFCLDLGIPGEQACSDRVVSQYKSNVHAAFMTRQAQARFTVLLLDPNRQPVDGTLSGLVNIVINSNCRFFNVTSKRIVNSLLNANWSAEQIWFIVGGCPEESTHRDPSSGLYIHQTRVDYIDFTAFSVLCHWPPSPPSTSSSTASDGTLHLSLPPPPTYWLYMHDTMEAGPHFTTKFLARLELLQHAWGRFPYAALTSMSSKSMNIGVYRHDYLVQKASSFEKEVATPLRELADVHARKAKGAELEDWFLHPLSRVMTLNQRIQSEAVDVYGQGVGRRVLHYPAVDLFKYQANYYVEQGAHFKTDL